MLFLMLKMDAAMLKHTLLSVQQTRSCSIYFRTLQGGSAIQVCKALCSKPICRQMGDRLRRKQSSWTWGRPCSSSCALGRALAYLIFPFLRSPMSARRWNAPASFSKTTPSRGTAFRYHRLWCDSWKSLFAMLSVSYF